MTCAGRNDRATQEFATVDWMAYQGAPDGGVSGKTRMPEWWTGTKCEKVEFPQARIRQALKPTSIEIEDHLKHRIALDQTKEHCFPARAKGGGGG